MKFLLALSLSFGSFIGIQLKIFAQTTQNPTELLLESWFESNQGDVTDYTQQMAYLEDLRDHPLDLNKASLDELKTLFFLPEAKLLDILNHRLLYGPFLCMEELQSIASISSEDVNMILPFIKVYHLGMTQPLSLRTFRQGQSALYLKTKRVLQTPDGYNVDSILGKPKFVGSPNYFSIRYKWQSGNHLKFGMIAEKDAGESIAWNQKTRITDHISIFGQIKKWRWIDNLIFGDYAVSFGQGLIIHNGFGAGKSTMVMNVKKNGDVFRPYTSINENLYFRGIATSIHIVPNFEFHVLYSSKAIDGVLSNDNGDSTHFVISSFPATGYHRTENEIKYKGNAKQRNIGLSLSYQYKNFKCNINHLNYSFNYPIAPGDQVYEIYKTVGLSTNNTSFDYSWRFKNIYLFGESALSKNGALAHLTGLLLSLDRKMDFSLLYRNYDKRYQCLNCNAFGESGKSQAEQGLYLGLELRPHFQWKIAAYADFFDNTWLKYKVDGITTGSEYAIRLEHTIKRKFSVYLQFFIENKENNSASSPFRTQSLESLRRSKWRLHLVHHLHKYWEIRARAELNQYRQGKSLENGFVLYQDVIFKPMASPFSFTSRFMVFQSQGFNSRLYSYENDILYEYALPFVSGTGQRFYLNTRCKINKWATLEFRYAITKYSDIDKISADTENEIAGNTKSEIKIQLKLSW
jgi:hypothetical protein